ARILRVADDPDATTSDLILEIPKWLVYNVAFHPKYQENGYLYLGMNGPTDHETERFDRVNRYTVDAEGKIDPTSELVIIEWLSNGHNGAAVTFGHDGMLYITSGDGTSDSDTWLSAQDVTNLLGSVLRIDVDHPDDDRPYSIPPDNPFLSIERARGELWAIGLRNPWRMCTDRKTGQIWVGNNGQDLWETAHLIRRGENYGWSVFEGSHPFYLNRELGPAPFVPPTLEHHHQEARSLTGGEVYYGTKLPELEGTYIYGDFSTGKVWGARHDGTQVTWHRELADTPHAIAAFAVTHSGELLIVEYGNGFSRLIPREVPADTPPFPQKLSETGLFVSVKDYEVQPGVIPYEVNAAGWVDGATAERHVAIPDDGSMSFSETRGLTLPDHAVAVQTLSLPISPDSPEVRRIETRILVRQEGAWIGYSYLWNDAQDDADLVEATGRDINLPVSTSEGAPATDATRPWRVPSRSECMSGHSDRIGVGLGLSQPQLNRDCSYGGQVENQIEVLQRIGVLAGNLERPLAEMPKLVDPYDAQQPLEQRARSYLHTNCSVCHILSGGGNSRMALEITTGSEGLAVIDQHPQHDTLGIANARIVAPGDPQRSVLYHRVSRRGRGQMPPLVTQVVDQRASDLFSEWIKSLPPSRKFVRAWTVDELQQEFDRLPTSGSVEKGQQVFQEAGCIQCHRRSNAGGGSGPDITNLSQRRKLAEVLESIVIPSKIIAQRKSRPWLDKFT
ncbi:MAG: PQQ-dependent sugar dehydrogenase, partial [Planctomycetota bacterium]|nr:PQQ-dependent sugar dehydrogenase [Planctomycetota bacterium]